MAADFFCAVKGRKIEEVDCAGTICKADDATIAVCHTCVRGKALADVGKRQVEYAAQTQTEQRPAQSVREKIQLATGCNTIALLAARIGSPATHVRTQIERLEAGKLPRRDNAVIPAIMRLGKLTLQDLLPGAEDIDFIKTAAPVGTDSEKTDTSERGMFDPNVGDDVDMSSSTDADAGQDAYDAAGAAMGLDVPSGLSPNIGGPTTPTPTLMGADPSEQLLTSGEMFALRRHDAPQQAPAPAPAPAPAGIPEGFELYEPFSAQTGQPVLSIGKGSEASISADAVRRFGLAAVPCVHLLFNRGTGQVGIKPLPRQAVHALKLQSTRKSQARCVSMRGMWRKLGIQPNPGIYPLTQDPSGLLVATITQQPSQGGEA